VLLIEAGDSGEDESGADEREPAPATAGAATKERAPERAPSGNGDGGRVKASPVARRMAREPQPKIDATKAKVPSRLDQLEQLLTRDGGATIAELVEATGW